MTGCDPAAGSSCCGCDGAADQCRTMEDQKSLDLRQLSTQKTDDARLGAEWSVRSSRVSVCLGVLHVGSGRPMDTKQDSAQVIPGRLRTRIRYFHESNQSKRKCADEVLTTRVR